MRFLTFISCLVFLLLNAHADAQITPTLLDTELGGAVGDKFGQQVGFSGDWVAITDERNAQTALYKVTNGQISSMPTQEFTGVVGTGRMMDLQLDTLAIAGGTQLYFYTGDLVAETWGLNSFFNVNAIPGNITNFGRQLQLNDDGTYAVFAGYGALRVFKQSGGTWIQMSQSTFFTTGFNPDDMQAVSISGDGLTVMGCQLNSCAIYKNLNNVWSHHSTFPIADITNAVSYLNVQLNYDGNIAVVTIKSTAANNNNDLRVFKRTTGAYTFASPNIYPSFSTPSAWGMMLDWDHSNSRLYVSDYNAMNQPTQKNHVGTVEVLEYNEAEHQFTHLFALQPFYITTELSAGAHFGSMLAANGDSVIVSAPDLDDKGAVYIYSTAAPPTGKPTTSPSKSPTNSPTTANPSKSPIQSPTAAPTTSQHKLVCDDPNVDCNVVNDLDFSYKKMEIVTYASNAPTVSNAQSFEFAVQYKTETPFELLNEIRICEYSTLQNLNCTGVKMWLDGVMADSTVVLDENSRQCCNFDTFGVFTRANIENTEGNLFFLMDKMFDSGPARRRNLQQEEQKFIFQRITEPVVPNEVAILYAFRLDDTELVIDGDNTRITLSVNEVDHSNNPDFDHSACDSRDITMGTIELSGCTLTLDAQTVPGKYEYLMPSVDYERCSSSVTTQNGQILYNSTIDLPDNNAPCYYFEPGNDIQPITVIIEQDSITDATQETTALGLSITDITTERCLPYEDYVLAHAKIVYTVRYKFNGTDVNLINTPFLNTVTNPMTTESKTCSANECIFVFKSTQCEPIYIADDGTGCVFERNDVYMLNELSVVEVGNPYSPISYTHIIDPLDTNTETTTYPLADCTTPDYLEFVNVTDQYNYELKIENVATADWTVQEDILDFFQELVLRLRIIDGPAFTNQDLQINTVQFTISDGLTDNDYTTVTFRLNDKKALMQFSGSKYYKDAHFCRHFDPQLSACTPFYDTGTSRSNPFVVSTLVNRLDDICQRTVDDTKTDFFSFLFPTWVKRIDTSSLKLFIRVTARLQVCSSISSDPAHRKLEQQKIKLNYLVASQSFDFLADGVTPTNSPTKTPTNSPTASPPTASTVAEDEEGLSPLVIGIIAASVTIAVLVLIYFCKN